MRRDADSGRRLARDGGSTYTPPPPPPPPLAGRRRHIARWCRPPAGELVRPLGTFPALWPGLRRLCGQRVRFWCACRRACRAAVKWQRAGHAQGRQGLSVTVEVALCCDVSLKPTSGWASVTLQRHLAGTSPPRSALQAATSGSVSESWSALGRGLSSSACQAGGLLTPPPTTRTCRRRARRAVCPGFAPSARPPKAPARAKLRPSPSLPVCPDRRA